MSNVTESVTPISRTERYTDRYSKEYRRKKRVKAVKTGGNVVMYVGSAGLMIPMIKRAQENQSGIMGLCAAGAGIVLAVGLGNVASRIFEKTVDKAIDFWDDVKPNGPANRKPSEPEEKPKEDNDDG